MATNLFLVRCGATAWHLEGLVVGHQDLEVCPEGQAQAQHAVDLLGGLDVAEVVSSPLSRAIHTANLFADRHGIDPTRDARLGPVSFGAWEGQPQAELQRSEAYRQLIAGQPDALFPDERMAQVHQRARASVQQALVDNPDDITVVVISHTIPLQLLLAGYLGLPLQNFWRLVLDPGSISLVRFEDFPRRTVVAAVNWSSTGITQLVG